MKKYAILCHPQALKVYKEYASVVLVSELKAIFKGINLEVSDFLFEDIEGVEYITFQTCDEPSAAAFSSVARFSAFFALFDVRSGSFVPKRVDANFLFTQNMPALLHYQGKTNEHFTRLMINLALSACKTGSQRISLLDPVAGKGTTLYDALMMGFDAYGIELGAKYFDEACHYAAKFMQSEKFKHTTKKDKILNIKSVKISDAYTIEFAPDKKSFSAKDTGIFKMFNADARISDRLVKKNSIDIIVGDLPYGIQHANKKSSKKNEKSRSSEGLFEEALPAFKSVLKKGGVMVFSFNEHTTSKKMLEEAAAKNKFTVLDGEEYDSYHHRVDSSIKRNLMVALKE